MFGQRSFCPFGFLRSVGAQASKLGVRRFPVWRGCSNIRSQFFDERSGKPITFTSMNERAVKETKTKMSRTKARSAFSNSWVMTVFNSSSVRYALSLQLGLIWNCANGFLLGQASQGPSDGVSCRYSVPSIRHLSATCTAARWFRLRVPCHC